MGNSLWCNYLSFGCEKIIESVSDCNVLHIVNFLWLSFDNESGFSPVWSFHYNSCVVYFYFSIILDILQLGSCKGIWI